MIVLDSASRWYGQVIGINDITCEIGPGVTALLGQNGAGKSTLIRLITGQLKPTTGSISVLGMNPFANPEVYRQIGYCPDIDSFPEHLTGYEFTYRMARMNDFDHAKATRRTQDAISLVGMEGRENKPLKGYSKGMRQRIKLAQAIVHDPELLLLDEPLNGLDPVGRRQFMDVLDKLAAKGKTIVVSSHVLFEVEQMTRSLLLLHRGRLLASGDLETIRSVIDRHPHRIRITTSEPRRLATHLICLPYVLSVQLLPDQSSLEVQTREPDKFYSEIPNIVLGENLPVTGLASPDNNLEAVFQYLVEK